MWMNHLLLVASLRFLIQPSSGNIVTPCLHHEFHCLCSAPGDVAEQSSFPYPAAACQEQNLSYVPQFLNPKLKSLRLTGNALLSFSLPPLIYLQLSVLDVSHNSISSLDFSQCPRLMRIDLSWNRLTALNESAFRGLNLLTHLNIAHNNIRQLLPAIFQPVSELTHLDLSENLLSGMNFFDGHSSDPNHQLFEKLEMLSLAGNKFASIEFCSLPQLPSLTVLDVTGSSHANLTCLLNPHRFPSLGVLNVSRCFLERLDLDALFDLSGNQTVAPAAIVLNLTGNQIRLLDYNPHNAERILQHRQNVSVELTGNPVLCDCSFYQVFLDLGSRFEQFFQGIHCLQTANRLEVLSSLQAQCLPTPSHLTPVVVALSLFLLLLGCIVVAVIFYRQRKAHTSSFVPLRWEASLKNTTIAADAESVSQHYYSESTSCTSPEMDIKMADGPPESDEDLENIYATIDEFYLNREHIYASEIDRPKAGPVTEL
ncbi:hypothetical protein BV898_04307 [Hypsibius exemplaris]|uniref:LRRCT domain-containing protein n=1 Tax=Hypsibius exemplaris TaxID=2072580 RepID=A0A1W0X2N9_HYPEX|nr:hypothetical protein BV898_04307 [Hypsibius exemplaris]